MYERMEAKGASATFTDSESSQDEEETKEQSNENTEKKRRKRTKEDVERELLELGDLYAILELEDKTYESTDKDIRKAY